jgi:hypothetical protein
MANRAAKVLVVVAQLVAACSNDPASPDTGGHFAGTYSLVTINGLPLPATLQPPSPAPSITVIDGTFVLSVNSGFSFSSNWQETADGVTTQRSASCTGTWTKTGNSFSFVEHASADCGGSYTGTWDGANGLTVAFANSLQAVFKR